MNFIVALIEINNMKELKRDLTTDISEFKREKRVLCTIDDLCIRELRWNRYIHLKTMY